MRADTALEYALFQLDPSRSRCELWISDGVETEKLATGSFKPFLSHLRAAQEQSEKGASSLSLQAPSPGKSSTPSLWFSKATLQRFVRFVSTPEILERLRLLDDELRQLEEAIGMLATNSVRDNGQVADISSGQVSSSGQNAANSLHADHPNNSACLLDGVKVSEHPSGTPKKPLLRVMDSCQFMLLNELQKTHAQAVAAGFDEGSVQKMLIFAEEFGADRLRNACLNFMKLSRERKLYLPSVLSQNESIEIADSDIGIALKSECKNSTMAIPPRVEALNIKGDASETDPPTILSTVSDRFSMRAGNGESPGVTRLLSPSSPPNHLQIEKNLSNQHPNPENGSWADKELSGTFDSIISRPLVKRSTSPRRRSFSPLRKVQINRSPARRPMVVVKNIAYSSPSSDDRSAVLHKHQHPAKTVEHMPAEDSTDSITESEEECSVRKPRNRRLSVQAAISLFESRQKDSLSVRKNQYGDSFRSAESAKPLSSRKSAIRQLSGGDDPDIRPSEPSSKLCSVHDLDLAEEKVEVKNQIEKAEVKGDRFGDVTRHQAEVFLQPHGMELLKQLRHESSMQLIARESCPPPMQAGTDSPRCHRKSSEDPDAAPGMPTQETYTDYSYHRAVSSEQSDMCTEKRILAVPHISDLQSAENAHLEDWIGEPFGSKAIVDSEKMLVVEQNYPQGDDLALTGAGNLSPDKVLIGSSSDDLTMKAVSQMGEEEEDSNLYWKTSIDLQPEMQSYQLVGGGESSDETNPRLVTGDSFITSERHSGNGSLKPWSIASDYGMISLLDVADGKLLQNSGVPTKENDSPGDDQKGRLYKQYRERRDAKFREESGAQRAEREAKLKSMQEVLERRKAELAERNVDKQSLSEGQCRHGKASASRASLTNLNKQETKSCETRSGEAHKQPQSALPTPAPGSQTTGTVQQSANSTPKSMREQIPNPRPTIARKLSPSSQKSSTTPASTTPRSTARSLALSSPNSVTKNPTITTPTGQGRASTRSETYASNKTLYRPVPSYPQQRKENTKPLSAKSGRLPQQDKVPSSRGSKSKASTSFVLHGQGLALPLESVSSNSSLQEEKNCEALAARMSMMTVSDVRVSQGSTEESVLSVLSPVRVLAETSLQSRAYKASMAGVGGTDVKPFLRKGHGIGPGAGREVLKLKASLAAEAAKANDDDDDQVLKIDGDGDGDDPNALISSTSVKNVLSAESEGDQHKQELSLDDEESTADRGKSSVCAPLLTSISETEPSQGSNNGLENTQVDENASEGICKSVSVSECKHFDLDPPLASSLLVQQEEPQPPKAPPPALAQDPSEDSNAALNLSRHLGLPSSSPRFTLQQHMSISRRYAILASTSDISSSHKLSPEHHVRRLSGGSSSPRLNSASREFLHLRYSLSPNVDAAKAQDVQSRKRWGNTYKPSPANIPPASKEAPRGFKRLLKFGRKSRSSANSNSEWISTSTTSGEDDLDEAKDTTNRLETVRPNASSLSSNLRKTADNISRISETECLTGTATRSFFSLSAFRKQRP